MKRNTPNEPAESSPPPAKPAKKRSPMLVAASAAQRHAPKRKWSFNDEGFECHVDLGDVHNELKRRL